MNLPAETARCDGLLPRVTSLNGKPMLAWIIDCPRREQCARYMQLVERDFDLASKGVPVMAAHYHSPGEACPDFIAEASDSTD